MTSRGTLPAILREGLAAPRRELRIPHSEPPILTVVVDTEEEFDWNAEFRRDATAVTAMRQIGVFQRLCEEYGIAPAYVADYPVVTDPEAAAALRDLQTSGRAEVGAHLHPWVTPPFDEEVSARNSYPGNLEPTLEAAKLHRLTAAVEQATGVRPKTYKAGRYGLGAHTTSALEAEGFEVDLSPLPAFDLSADGGPDYSSWSPRPYRFGSGERLVGLPTTGAFVGFLGSGCATAYRVANRPALRRAGLSGILSRLRAADRLRLSPEAASQPELRRLTAALLRRGLRTFSFALHSPSLLPGCTPYVRTASDLEALLDSCRRYFDWFLGDLGGSSLPPHRLARHLQLLCPPDPPA
jgi:hypothetical protein